MDSKNAYEERGPARANGNSSGEKDSCGKAKESGKLQEPNAKEKSSASGDSGKAKEKKVKTSPICYKDKDGWSPSAKIKPLAYDLVFLRKDETSKTFQGW